MVPATCAPMPCVHKYSHFVMLVVLATYFSKTESLKLEVDSDKPHKHHHYGRKPLAEGCSLVYLDIGSNVGVQVRKLFEPHKYPEAKILPHFDKYFGNADFRSQPSNTTGLCAFGFEANPGLVGRLQKIQEAYRAQNWRVTFIAPRIVSDVNNQDVTLYVDKSEKSNDWNQWGSSITNWNKGESVTVKTLDFAKWFEEEIMLARPKVVLGKMDIEGSEYLVVPSLIAKNFLCGYALNAIAIEWHKKANPTTRKRFELMNDIGAQKCIHKTNVERLDDETYVLDGAPLPGEVSVDSMMRMSRGSVEHNINVSKALYDAAQLLSFKRAGTPAGGAKQEPLDEDE